MQELVRHLRTVTFEDLPEREIREAKKTVLDTLACMIAGSSVEGSETLAGLAKGWGGRDESTIAVYGGRVPAHNAALVNCTMARALDFDQVLAVVPGHPYATLIPSLLAIAESSKRTNGKVIRGKDLVLALVLGSDLIFRLRAAGGRAATGTSGWASELFHPIGLAAAGARMLGFDDTKMLNAMGLAYAQTAGNNQGQGEGASTVRLQQGLSAKAGVLSLMLAEEGFTGPNDMLFGKYGFYKVYIRSEPSREVLTSELGKRFEGSHFYTKLFPCCLVVHGVINAALQIAREHKLNANDIERCCLYCNSAAYNSCGEGERKMAPQTVPDAQFSYHYAVATAIVKGKVSIEDFTEAAIRDPEVLAMARKVSVTVDPEKDASPFVIGPTDIEIHTKDGRQLKLTAARFRGDPDNPVSWDDAIQKLKDCAAFSARPISRQKVAAISEMVAALDELSDLTAIVECLA